LQQQAPAAPAADGGGWLGGLLNKKPEQAMGLAMLVKQIVDMIKGSGGGLGGAG
jgi:hypothetical protein